MLQGKAVSKIDEESTGKQVFYLHLFIMKQYYEEIKITESSSSNETYSIFEH